MLSHSDIHRNAGAGVAVVTVSVAPVEATISRNNFGDNGVGISADGTAASVYANANSFASQFAGADFEQKNAGQFFSYGDNVGPISKTGTITTVTGQ